MIMLMIIIASHDIDVDKESDTDNDNNEPKMAGLFKRCLLKYRPVGGRYIKVSTVCTLEGIEASIFRNK